MFRWVTFNPNRKKPQKHKKISTKNGILKVQNHRNGPHTGKIITFYLIKMLENNNIKNGYCINCDITSQTPFHI